MLPLPPQKKDVLIDWLAGHFQRSYDPTLAWSQAISILQTLPGLRGIWMMSSVSEAGLCYDQSGQGRNLTYNGNPTYNRTGLAPYIDFDGVGDYLSRADEAGLDIIGNEASIAAALRGLTIGGWFWWDTITANEGLMTKGTGAVGATSYMLRHRGDSIGDPIEFSISTGAALKTATGTDTSALTASVWHYIVGRFVPSTSVDLYVDNYKYTFTTTIPATLVNSAIDFNISGENSGTNPLNGRASICFLYGAALPDEIIKAVYHHQRAVFRR